MTDAVYNMQKIVPAVISLVLLALAPVAAAEACSYPKSPPVPNGETVTEAEMREAQKNVRAFVAAAEAYLACLSSIEENAAEPLTTRQAEINVARYNAMVDEMHRVSDEYNVAVRIFKARQ